MEQNLGHLRHNYIFYAIINTCSVDNFFEIVEIVITKPAFKDEIARGAGGLLLSHKEMRLPCRHFPFYKLTRVGVINLEVLKGPTGPRLLHDSAAGRGDSIFPLGLRTLLVPLSILNFSAH